MQYADHHFVEDSTFYSEISKLASTLLSQAKWYPHPLLLYKTVLYQLARLTPTKPNPTDLTIAKPHPNPSPLLERGSSPLTSSANEKI